MALKAWHGPDSQRWLFRQFYITSTITNHYILCRSKCAIFMNCAAHTCTTIAYHSTNSNALWVFLWGIWKPTIFKVMKAVHFCCYSVGEDHTFTCTVYSQICINIHEMIAYLMRLSWRGDTIVQASPSSFHTPQRSGRKRIALEE